MKKSILKSIVLTAIISVFVCGLFVTPQISYADQIVADEYAIKYYCGETIFSTYIGLDDKLYVAGDSSRGRLGLNNPARIVYKPLVALENVKTVTTSKSGFSLVLTKNNELFGFGYNRYSNLGLNTGLNTNNSTNYVELPTKITLPNITIVDIKAGYNHSLLLDSEGSVYSAGSNNMGQLGLDETIDNNAVKGVFTKIPQNLFDDQKIVAISSAEDASYALTQNGEVYSWGTNQFGLLGTGESDLRFLANKPQKLKSLSNIVAISARASNAMALDDQGNAFVWGNNNFKQFGIPSFAGQNSNVPMQIDDLYDASGNVVQNKIEQVLCGGIVNYLLDEQGFVYSFGKASEGETGFDIQKEPYNAHPYVLDNKVVAPVRISFFVPRNIYEDYHNPDLDESIKSLLPTTNEPMDVRISVLVNTSGTRTFMLDDQNNMWSFGNNGDMQACSGDINLATVPIRSTLYRVGQYDNVVKPKNYIIAPVVTLIVIYSLGLGGIVYLEIKRAKTKKLEKLALN